MTISYTAQVATCKKFGCFFLLLLRWKGSVYKLVWLNLLIFLGVYYLISWIYLFVLEDNSKRVFEGVVNYCNNYGSLIPLSFVLGFYVTTVMNRWWEQYLNIPWPDSLAVFVSAHIQGFDERGRLMRRTIMRYACLCIIVTMRSISPRVQRRFPTWQHFVEAGLMFENEKKIFELIEAAFPKRQQYWLPIVWAAAIVTRARKESRIHSDFIVQNIINELNNIREYCATLRRYSIMSTPLLYTQVVTLAVYTYFLGTVVGRQWTERSMVEDYKIKIDMYFPVFTLLELFFYIGWLRVAETLINPFGDDDDDFEVNWIIDRNLQMSYLIVDEMHNAYPNFVKDQYWDEVIPAEMHYDPDSNVKKPNIPDPSTAYLDKQYSKIKFNIPATQWKSSSSSSFHSAYESIDEEDSFIEGGNDDDFERLKAERLQNLKNRKKQNLRKNFENPLKIQTMAANQSTSESSDKDTTIYWEQPTPDISQMNIPK